MTLWKIFGFERERERERERESSSTMKEMWTEEF
jgi:hypothetical protein